MARAERQKLNLVAHWVVRKLALVEIDCKGLELAFLELLPNSLVLVQLGIVQEAHCVLAADFGHLCPVPPRDVLRNDHRLDLLQEVLSAAKVARLGLFLHWARLVVFDCRSCLTDGARLNYLVLLGLLLIGGEQVVQLHN